MSLWTDGREYSSSSHQRIGIGFSMNSPIFSWAKLNQFLYVTSRLDSGYHLIYSLFTRISLCDIMRIDAIPGDGEISITMHNGPNISMHENICYRTILEYFRDNPLEKIKENISVDIVKNIPWGAGLGGGSSNAASLLLWLNERYGLYNFDELLVLGASIGSDIPFFLTGASYALVEGRGERVSNLEIPDRLRRFRFIVVFPRISVNTARIYRGLKLTEIGADVSIVNLDSPYNDEFFYNTLYLSAKRLYPELEDIKSRLSDAAGQNFYMTGSGSGLFCPYWDDRDIDWERLACLTEEAGWRLWCVESV